MDGTRPFYPNWVWNEVRRYWYFQHPATRRHVGLDSTNDQLIDIQTGSRTPRSPLVALPQVLAPPTHPYPASPTQSNAAYTSSRPLSASSHDTDQLAAAFRAVNIGQAYPRPPESITSRGSSTSQREAPPPLNTPVPAVPRPQPQQATSVTPQVTQRDGMRLWATRNDGGVQTIFADRPAERITDPDLLRVGVTAHRRLFGTDGDQEVLYSTFRLQKRGFFVLGRVFQILWSEPAGEAFTAVTSLLEPTDAMRTGLFEGRFGESVYSKVRRFVVVRPSSQYSSAVPIMSYGHQGVGKKDVIKHEHAIIFIGKEAPRPHRSEAPRRNELPMRSRAIRVVPDEPTERLDDMSRINFGKVHTIEHNLKVRSVGMVHPHYLEALSSQFANVVLPAATREDPRAQALLTRQGSQESAGASGPSRNVARPDVGARSGSSGVPQVPGGAADDENANSGGRPGEDENNEEGSDEEASEGDDEGQVTPRLNRRDRIIARLRQRGLSEAQATQEANTAIQLQTQYSQLLQSRYTSAQAVSYLASRLQKEDESITREAAVRDVTARLQYGN